MTLSSNLHHNPGNTDYNDLRFAESLAHYSVNDSMDYGSQPTSPPRSVSQQAEAGLPETTLEFPVPYYRVETSDDYLNSGDHGLAPGATEALGRPSLVDFTPSPENWWHLLRPIEHADVTGQEGRAFDEEAKLENLEDKYSRRAEEDLGESPARRGGTESFTQSASCRAKKTQRGVSVKRYRATMNERFDDLYNAILRSQPRKRSKICNGQSGLSKVSDKLYIPPKIDFSQSSLERNHNRSD